MERKDYPCISEVAGVVNNGNDVTMAFIRKDFSVPRDMFMLSLGTLRGVLPENQRVAIIQEINNALDYETGVLDAGKLSTELAVLTVAFSEYARKIGLDQSAITAPGAQRGKGLTGENLLGEQKIVYGPTMPHEEYISRLEALGNRMYDNSPQAQELLARREQELDKHREQGLLPETFGERIVFYRKRLGVHQADLARMAKIAPSVLNRYEKGTRQTPVKAIELIARKLLLTLSYTSELIELAGYSAK